MSSKLIDFLVKVWIWWVSFFIEIFNFLTTFFVFFSKILYEFETRFPLIQDNLLDNFELILDAAGSVYSLEMNLDLPEEGELLFLKCYRKLFSFLEKCNSLKWQNGDLKVESCFPVFLKYFLIFFLFFRPP